MTGALTRTNFGTVDEREHYWFRTGSGPPTGHRCAPLRSVPRPKLRDQLRDLLGVDIEQEPGRYTVVPEGIDLSVTTAARTGTCVHPATHPALTELAQLVAALPAGPSRAADRVERRPAAPGEGDGDSGRGLGGRTRRCGNAATC